MAGFRCGSCGRWHDHASRDVAFGLPDAIFELSDDERTERAWISSDLCVLDEQANFVRGMLYVPVSDDGGRVGWGVWAHIAQADYERYSQVWGTDAELQVPPFTGHLANEIHPYPGSVGLDVTVQLMGGSARPTFTVVSETHQLGMDQRQRISPERAAEHVAIYHRTQEARPPTWTERLRWCARRVWSRDDKCGPHT